MGEGRRLRADAAANRRRILDAAREVFAEAGPNPSFDSIALRAGVGNATLYRHFPGIEELRRLVYTQRLDEQATRFEAVLWMEDSWEALAAVIRWAAELADVNLLDRVFGEGFGDPELDRRATPLREATDAMMLRAKADGHLAPDATPDDLRIAIYALCGIVGRSNVTAVQRARFAEILLHGLRAR